MQRQLALWPAEGLASRRIWEELGEPEQTGGIVALARLIRKAVEPDSAEASAEDDHER